MVAQIGHLKDLLEQMVEAAEQKDKAAVRRLNSEFERGMPPLSDRSQKIIDYDNCRQSCMMAFTFPQMYKNYVKDARQRFKQINGARARQDKYA
jgi:hypothetical protein